MNVNSTFSSEPIIPTAEEVLLARDIIRALEQHPGHDTLRLLVTAAGQDMTAVELPPIATRLLIEILKHMAAGNAVSLMPVKPEITAQQAADLLNVSRPYVEGLIDKGALPARMAGNQRCVPLSDVLAYKRETLAKSNAALDEMVALSQEMGLE